MKRNKLLDKIRKYRAKYIDIFVDYTFDLSNRMQFLLERNSMDQKDLARELGKSESEISKWLSGSHNFTLKTIAKIEDVLGDKLLEVINENGVQRDQRVSIYLIQSEKSFTPKYNTHKEVNSLKKYSPKYKNTSLAEC